jgi:hypothetical protein
MKYAIEKGSVPVFYVLSSIQTGSDIRNLIAAGGGEEAYKRHSDRISVIFVVPKQGK